MSFENINTNIICNFIMTYRISKIDDDFVKLTECTNDIIKLAITRAYGDIKRRCWFIKNAKYDNKEVNVKENLLRKTYAFIDNLKINKINDVNFDNEHKKFCCSIIGKYNGYNSNDKQRTGEITYGLAQKLLNMTLKYLYVEKYNNRFHDLPNDIEDKFHVPIDSFIMLFLENLYNDYQEKPELINKIFINFSKGKKGYSITGKYNCQTWSNLNYTNYNNFYNDFKSLLKENIKPLEAEFYLWNILVCSMNKYGSASKIDFLNNLRKDLKYLKGYIFK